MMNNKQRSYLLITLFIIICISSFLSIMSLIEDNPMRERINQCFVYYDKEDIGVLKDAVSLGDWQETDSPDRKEIGPLPEGKFISAYIKEGTEFYDEPYRYKYYINNTYWNQEPYYDKYGYLHYRDVYHKTRTPYWGTGYRQKKYKYIQIFSIYDISDQISFFEKEYSAYNRLLNELDSNLTAYDHWTFDPKLVKSPEVFSVIRKYYKNDAMALSYRTKDQKGVHTIRSVYFANKKAYVLEVRSNYDNKGKANAFIENVTTFNLNKFNNTVVITIILGGIFAIIVACLFIYLFIKPYWKSPIKNKSAKRMFMYSLCMTVLNILIISFIFYKLYPSNDYELLYNKNIYIDLRILVILTAPTLFIMDILTCTALFVKARKEYQYDYLIQDWLQPYYRSRLNNQQERKTLVSLLYYPLYTLGPMPLGVLCLLYIIPFSIIIFVTLEIRHLYRWINKDTITVQNENNYFMDYYVILDLKKEADKDEIEKAFNSAMAKYNSAGDNPLYGKQFFNEVQEAYAVLSSINQLRPEYDIEYDSYKESNSTSYAFVNKQLENEIENIRNKLYNINIKRKNRNLNIIIVSFILLIVIAFSIITAIMGDSSSFSGNYSGSLCY